MSQEMHGHSGCRHITEQPLDEDLLQSIKEGPREYRNRAFSDLYVRLEPGIRKTIRRICFWLDEGSIQDISQDTWIIIAKKINAYEERGKPISHWANAIARREALAYRRKSHRFDQVPLSKWVENSSYSAWGNPEDKLISSENQQELFTRVSSLPPRPRMVIEARILGFSYKEIAATLEATLDNVYQHASQGRKKMQTLVPMLVGIWLSLVSSVRRAKAATYLRISFPELSAAVGPRLIIVVGSIFSLLITLGTFHSMSGGATDRMWSSASSDLFSTAPKEVQDKQPQVIQWRTATATLISTPQPQVGSNKSSQEEIEVGLTTTRVSTASSVSYGQTSAFTPATTDLDGPTRELIPAPDPTRTRSPDSAATQTSTATTSAPPSTQHLAETPEATCTLTPPSYSTLETTVSHTSTATFTNTPAVTATPHAAAPPPTVTETPIPNPTPIPGPTQQQATSAPTSSPAGMAPAGEHSDHDKGHGNDPDHYDEDNPGKSGGKPIGKPSH